LKNDRHHARILRGSCGGGEVIPRAEGRSLSLANDDSLAALLMAARRQTRLRARTRFIRSTIQPARRRQHSVSQKYHDHGAYSRRAACKQGVGSISDTRHGANVWVLTVTERASQASPRRTHDATASSSTICASWMISTGIAQ
jgi:hypothetical protein